MEKVDFTQTRSGQQWSWLIVGVDSGAIATRHRTWIPAATIDTEIHRQNILHKICSHECACIFRFKDRYTSVSSDTYLNLFALSHRFTHMFGIWAQKNRCTVHDIHAYIHTSIDAYMFLSIHTRKRLSKAEVAL